jgi:hypothetical protein
MLDKEWVDEVDRRAAKKQGPTRPPLAISAASPHSCGLVPHTTDRHPNLIVCS